MVLGKTPECPLDNNETKPVNPKGNQFWTFTGRIDAEAEALILWPPDAKIWLISKTLMQEKIEGISRRGWQRVIRLNGITDLMDMHFSKLWKLVMNKVAWHDVVHGFAKCWTWLCNCTDPGLHSGAEKWHKWKIWWNPNKTYSLVSSDAPMLIS